MLSMKATVSASSSGIEQLVVQGVKKDYLKVKYAGEDSLYIPVDQLGMLQKYVGGDGVTPRLEQAFGKRVEADQGQGTNRLSTIWLRN